MSYAGGRARKQEADLPNSAQALTVAVRQVVADIGAGQDGALNERRVNRSELD
jgi:hypothetical protein